MDTVEEELCHPPVKSVKQVGWNILQHHERTLPDENRSRKYLRDHELCTTKTGADICHSCTQEGIS